MKQVIYIKYGITASIITIFLLAIFGALNIVTFILTLIFWVGPQ